MSAKIISFPHIGSYHVPIKFLLNALAGKGNKAISPPPITKKTLELGTKHSPDFVCIPFKYNLGNYIEVLENGANVLVQTSGGCRMGFYGEVQEQILRDLGYELDFYTIDAERGSAMDFYKAFKDINPKLSITYSIAAFAVATRMAYAIDGIEEFIRKNIGFELETGSFERMEKQFLHALAQATNVIQVGKVYREYLLKFQALPICKPSNPKKVGVVGELYIVMEPFSNYCIEKELAKFGMEVTRFLTISYRLFSKKHTAEYVLKNTGSYLKYDIGADATDSVGKSLDLARAGYDGIIHLKPFGCTPEVNSMPIVQRISQDFKIPVLYFSFDSQTSETGVKTRLEAFADMIDMKVASQ
ncbi:MAG: hypothetical protein LBL34_03915 [Clostridiales bacterium]|jgi:predicted nucleotide-binding protein (sugar kinase/HSP70/actin superfamily)|nr:hypothetical protein [Clostridiales bacterium]